MVMADKIFFNEKGHKQLLFMTFNFFAQNPQVNAIRRKRQY